MKKYNYLAFIIALTGMLLTTSCGDDFLTADSAKAIPSGASVTDEIVRDNLTSAYHILLRDNYGSGYNSVLLLADLRSDDVYKGGESATNELQLNDLNTFALTPSTDLGGFWYMTYVGVARSTMAIANATVAVEGSNMDKVAEYKAEALFLRAYYYHQLWKNWGNIPYYSEPLQEPFLAPQLTAGEVYAKIMEDIKAAEDLGKLQMKSSEIARTNLAALYMLKARIVMYQKDAAMYDEVAKNMADIINSGEYDLLPVFDDLWLDANEFCIESIFESNQLPQGGDWSSYAGNPFGFGTVLPRYLAPEELKDPDGVFANGWGFEPVRAYLWESDFFEPGDSRKEGSINNWIGKPYNPRYQDTGYFLRKYAARIGYEKGDLNFCNNVRHFRYAETLLNYAELVGVLGAKASGGVSAQTCLDLVRKRAFGRDASIPVNQVNIENERHKEFIGEGLRYWDLIRWDKAATVLTDAVTTVVSPAGINSKSEEHGQTTWQWSRTWKSHNKYLPIPQTEIAPTLGTAYPIKQNEGYN
ncbi:MAG: RagB/SusD family nutrient uptake outer membrane protein [Candidatus Symbiothrix sp.]|jgi:hypothetical protein|nr:RagB/SusD family nutrient uptake outer membrane protein [Candidatus Symbiothrix sp.]